VRQLYRNSRTDVRFDVEGTSSKAFRGTFSRGQPDGLWQGDGIQLNPRYDADPLIRLDGPPSAILEPAVRQRRRLATALAAFTEEQWAHPSRCDGWTNRDVIVHLDSTNSFWAFSIASGLKGEPTRFLATFDPVTSPAALVAGTQEIPSSEVLDRFAASTAALTDLLASLAGDDWSTIAEAPPGHLAISAVAHHALWDSWVHERDILAPLGITPDEESDEIAACLRYGAALAPAFAVTNGNAERGVLAVAVVDPETEFVVDIGEHIEVRRGRFDGADLELTGDALPVLEALSIRRLLDQAIDRESAWMIDGLAAQFDA
jgi:uncharacterized protein (TIGR03083 family)